MAKSFELRLTVTTIFYITHTPWLSDRSYSVDGNHRHMFYLTFGLPKQLRITFLFYLFILQTIFWVLYPSRAYHKGFFLKKWLCLRRISFEYIEKPYPFWIFDLLAINYFEKFSCILSTWINTNILKAAWFH